MRDLVWLLVPALVYCTDVQLIEDQASVPILTPSLSGRRTAKIKLHNGLEAYLVSDPGVDQSGAVLVVEAGSLDDPKEYAGTAHFLEHLLFMGTRAYPDESEYQVYMQDHGGKVNAYTSSDHTAYMFSINHDAFEGGLDRFSHFFIDPLLNPSCISGELVNVDHEHAKNVEHDGRRAYQIFKATANPAHPITGFSTGNKETLGKIPQEVLRTWYEKNYTSDQMHLMVVSKEPIERLIALVEQDFSAVMKRERERVTSRPSMLSAQQIGHITYIKPIRELRQLSLCWEMSAEFVSDLDKWAAKTVAHLLEQESATSLVHLLKKEQLIDGLSVELDQVTQAQGLFKIHLDLTPYGLTQTDRVFQLIFQTLSGLKQQGVPAHFFYEMQQMATLNYQYQSRANLFNTLMDRAESLVREPLATYPIRGQIPSTYDPAHIQAFLATLLADQCYFVLQADPQLTNVPVDQTEKWAQAQFAVKNFPQEELAMLDALPPNPAIDLPLPNRFVPKDLVLLQAANETPPTLLANHEGAKIYFAQDAHYQVPELALLFGFATPLLDGSAKQEVLADLYLKVLQEKLAATLSAAKLAGLEASFSQKERKVQIALHGFSTTLQLLAHELFEQMRNLDISQDQFDLYRACLKDSYDNADKEIPFFQTLELLSTLLYSDSSFHTDKLKAACQITYAEWQAYQKNLFQKAYVEGLVYGNIEELEAKSLWNKLYTTLKTHPYPQGATQRRHLLLLPEQDGPHLVSHPTQRQGHAAALLIQEGPFSFTNRGAQRILGIALKESFYDTLRTKQQTGYIVTAWDTESERQLLQFFAVQSSSHEPRDLIARFELFLEEFVKNVRQILPKDRFEKICHAHKTRLQMPPENLPLMATRLYQLGFEYEGDFAWLQKQIDALDLLEYDQVVAAADQFLSRANRKRLALLMEGRLTKENTFRYDTTSLEALRKAGTYISWH